MYKDKKVAMEKQNEWQKANFDRVNLLVPNDESKGYTKAQIKAHAEIADGGSINAFINRAIKETIDKESAK